MVDDPGRQVHRLPAGIVHERNNQYVMGVEERLFSWRQRKSLAQQLFDALAAHPNLAPLLSLFPPAGTAGAVRRERFLAILLRDGFPPDVALRIYTSVGHYVVGFAVQLGAHLITSEPGAGSPITLPDLDPASYPATATIAAAGARPATLAEEFTYGLGLIFAGIERTEKTRESP